MCGIGGFIRTGKSFLLHTEPTLRNLAFYNRLRGVDAFGAFKVIQSTKKLESIKDVGDPYKLLNTDNGFKSFFNSPGECQYFVMHNRHSTRGENNLTNAHPFVVKKSNGKGDIVLVHNGTIHHNSVEREYPAKTDSHTLAKMIADGVSMTDMEAALWGSYALVWYDSEDHTLHFTRNSERPLGFVHTLESIWFGSEVYNVAGAVERNQTKVKDIERLEVNQEWIWHFDGKEFDKKTFPLKPQKLSGKSGGSHYQNPQSRYYESEAEEYVDLTGGAYGEPEQEYPKSSSSSGATQVVVPDFPVPLRSKPHRDYHKASPDKPRFRAVNGAALGYGVGDYVCFSLTDFSATDRSTQVRMEGTPIAFRSDGGLELLDDVEIRGMVALGIDEIDNTNCLWQGTISHIVQSDKQPKKYIFSLRDIESRKDSDDPFRGQHMGVANPLEPKTKEQPSWLKELAKKMKPKTQSTESTTSEDTSLVLRPCSACNEVTDTFHNIDAARLHEDDKKVNLTFCRKCFIACLADADLMWKHIDNARQAQGFNKEGEEVISSKIDHTISFVHQEVTTQQ